MNEMRGQSDTERMDGNAAAGLLSEVFARDVTVAHVVCAGCGRRDDIGALYLYAPEMGAVLRCRGCSCVVLRLTRTPTHLCLDATGSQSIAIPIVRTRGSDPISNS